MNLVLTSIYNLAAPAVEPFLHSLRSSGCAEPVIVFATRISDECRDVLKRHGATVVECEYEGLPMAYASLARRVGLAARAVRRYYWNHRRGEKDFRWLFVNCWRFFCFMNYVSRLTEKPSYVLLADIRDVVFQKNPFENGFETGLCVAQENSRRIIRQSHGTRKWLWEAVGRRETQKLAHRNVVCAGTTAGDHASIMWYLELMTTWINRRFFWALFDSIDQGLHNYFVHNRLIQPVRVFENWNGPFLTLDSEEVGPENKNAEGYLCNRDGSIIPIVHQYDRIPGLFKPGERRPECWRFYQCS